MKSKLTLLILLIAVFSSCKKTTNLDVKLSTSGKLTYRITDDAGKGMPNVKISLFDGDFDPNLNTILLDTRLTDPNGQVDFGDLNPDNYLLIAEDATVNNVVYAVQDYVQVVTGAVKNKEVKITDYSGTISIIIKSYMTNQLLKNIGVIMVPRDKFKPVETTAMQLKVSDFSGVTDENGAVRFKIPSNKTYGVYVYNMATNASYYYGDYVSVQKGRELNYPIWVYQL